MSALPSGIAVVNDGEHILVPEGVSESEQEWIAANKPTVLNQLRACQMDEAGFYTVVPAALLRELRAAACIGLGVRTTAATRYSPALRLSNASRIGDREWSEYRAGHPKATRKSRPRIRVLSIYLQEMGHIAWDLDVLSDEQRQTLFKAALHDKVLVGHDLEIALAWLFEETSARPRMAIDTVLLLKQIRPAALYAPYRMAASADCQKRAAGENLIHGYRNIRADIGYVAGCLKLPRAFTTFQNAESWCISVLSADHLQCVKEDLSLSFGILSFLFPHLPIDLLAEQIRTKSPWYLPFETSLRRLAEAHSRGVGFDLHKAREFRESLEAEISDAAQELLFYPDFGGLVDQLACSSTGLTKEVKLAIASYAASHGIKLPVSEWGVPLTNRDVAVVSGANQLPAWPFLDRLQSCKMALSLVDEYSRMSARDGFLHSLVTFSTVTGRTTSVAPNLQGVPNGDRFRTLFKARPGHLILAADYSAIELRIASALAERAVSDIRRRVASDDDSWFLRQVISGIHDKRQRNFPDGPPPGRNQGIEWLANAISSASNIVLRRRTQVMARIFQRGLDPHLVTGIDMAKRASTLSFSESSVDWLLTRTGSEREVLKKQLESERQSAKAANFGLLYGMQDVGLHRYGISKFGLTWTLPEASEARLGWFKLYPEFWLWHQWTKFCQAEKRDRAEWRVPAFEANAGKLVLPEFDIRLFRSTTLSGRPIAALDNLRRALNYQDQGSGADILASAIAELPNEIADMMLMPIHDELVFEVPTTQIKDVRAKVESVMKKAALAILGHAIPVEIHCAVGETWAGESE